MRCGLLKLFKDMSIVRLYNPGNWFNAIARYLITEVDVKVPLPLLQDD